jgi:hypothetical protein
VTAAAAAAAAIASGATQTPRGSVMTDSGTSSVGSWGGTKEKSFAERLTWGSGMMRRCVHAPVCECSYIVPMYKCMQCSAEQQHCAALIL